MNGYPNQQIYEKSKSIFFALCTNEEKINLDLERHQLLNMLSAKIVHLRHAGAPF